MKKLITIFSVLGFLMQLHAADRRAALRYDFSDPESIQKSWEFHCAVLLTPRTVFKVENISSAQNGKALVVEANKASGVLMTDPKVNLRKNPVMRWRWRLVRPVQISPKSPEPDDQAIVIYLGDGTMLSQKSIGYRWEVNTPIGQKKKISYAGGMMQVHALCIRNSKDPVGKWIVEEKDVLADFIKAYKRFPGEYFILGVGANSQYSKSNTRVEIDYIEFIPRKTNAAK